MKAAGQNEQPELTDRQDVESGLDAPNEVQLWIGDMWDDVTEEDRNLLIQSEQEYSQRSFFSNIELLKRYDEWKIDQ